MFVAHKSAPARPRCRRRGAAAVEFALVAPLLVLLILGLIEFGRMMMVQQVLTNGAREGARKAVLPGVTDTVVYQTVDDFMTGSSLSGHSRSVSPGPSGAAPGDAVTVTVSIPFSKVSWLPVPQWLGNNTLTARAVMRKEED